MRSIIMHQNAKKRDNLEKDDYYNESLIYHKILKYPEQQSGCSSSFVQASFGFSAFFIYSIFSSNNKGFQ